MPPFLAKFGLHILIIVMVLLGFAVLGGVIYFQNEARLEDSRKITALAEANAIQKGTIDGIQNQVLAFNTAMQSINAGMIAITATQTQMYKVLTQFQDNKSLLTAAIKDPTGLEKQTNDAMNAVWTNLRDLSDPAKFKAELNALPKAAVQPSAKTTVTNPPSLLERLNPLRLF